MRFWLKKNQQETKTRNKEKNNKELLNAKYNVAKAIPINCFSSNQSFGIVYPYRCSLIICIYGIKKKQDRVFKMRPHTYNHRD